MRSPRQGDRPRNRLAHQAGIPGEAASRKPARRSVELVRQLHCPEGAFLDAQRPETLDGNQGYREVEREIELTRVALFTWRQLSEQIERALEMSARLGMGGSCDTAQPGAAPPLDRRIQPHPA